MKIYKDAIGQELEVGNVVVGTLPYSDSTKLYKAIVTRFTEECAFVRFIIPSGCNSRDYKKSLKNIVRIAGTNETIIDNKELKELNEAAEWLNCLQMAGVDNWDGYDYAFDYKEEYYPDSNEDEEEDENEKVEEMKQDNDLIEDTLAKN